jgi:hypothetical protein
VANAGLKITRFGSVANKGVTGGFFGSVTNKELEAKMSGLRLGSYRVIAGTQVHLVLPLVVTENYTHLVNTVKLNLLCSISGRNDPAERGLF